MSKKYHDAFSPVLVDFIDSTSGRAWQIGGIKMLAAIAVHCRIPAEANLGQIVTSLRSATIQIGADQNMLLLERHQLLIFRSIGQTLTEIILAPLHVFAMKAMEHFGEEEDLFHFANQDEVRGALDALGRLLVASDLPADAIEAIVRHYSELLAKLGLADEIWAGERIRQLTERLPVDDDEALVDDGATVAMAQSARPADAEAAAVVGGGA